MLGVDPALDRVTASLEAATNSELLAPGQPQLLLDQIDTCHHLGDWVLDLNAGVHLHEIEAPCALQEKLDRAGVLVSNMPGQSHRGLSHTEPQFGGQCR